MIHSNMRMLAQVPRHNISPLELEIIESVPISPGQPTQPDTFMSEADLKKRYDTLTPANQKFINSLDGELNQPPTHNELRTLDKLLEIAAQMDGNPVLSDNEFKLFQKSLQEPQIQQIAKDIFKALPIDLHV